MKMYSDFTSFARQKSFFFLISSFDCRAQQGRKNKHLKYELSGMKKYFDLTSFAL